jgi:hypothetical protein
MHRRFADRMLSMFKPVRRYGCTNYLCGYEAIVRKNSAVGQRPIVAAAGFAGAALAGALVGVLVMVIGLYVASDDSRRAEVKDAYAGAQHDLDSRLDAGLALPGSTQLPEIKYEVASMLEADTETGELKIGFMPSAPTVLPAAPQTGASAASRRESRE